MKLTFNHYKWLNLLGFMLLYNTIYVGRFNLTNVLPLFSLEMEITETQMTLINSAVYISYAIGSLINGRIADGRSARNVIAMGVLGSIVANILIILSNSWQEIFTICIINGYFQSMIWIGGACLIVRWWKSKERGVAFGFANFASGMSHVTAYLLPILIGMLFPYISWKGQYVVPMGIVSMFLIIFWLLTTEDPEKVGLAPYNEDNPLVSYREAFLKEEILKKHGNPWRYFFTRPKFIWWCIIAMLSSLCRYGLLKWIPIYYSSSQIGNFAMSSVFTNLILPIGMAFGTLIITWLAVKKFLLNKGVMVICSAALCGSLMLIFPIMSSTTGVLMGIFCTGFFLYGINGLLWIYALDRGGRLYAGTTVGILNCFAYMGAALEAFVFPLVLKISGEMINIFLVMEIICIGMVICGMIASERDTELEKEDD